MQLKVGLGWLPTHCKTVCHGRHLVAAAHLVISAEVPFTNAPQLALASSAPRHNLASMGESDCVVCACTTDQSRLHMNMINPFAIAAGQFTKLRFGQTSARQSQAHLAYVSPLVCCLIATATQQTGIVAYQRQS